jgi:hypothetical protein
LIILILLGQEYKLWGSHSGERKFTIL